MYTEAPDTVVLILIDGFPPTYLSEKDTPFLCKMANEGLQATIKPLFAFRGIEATLFTGLEPNQHGIWAEFRLRQTIIDAWKKVVHEDSDFFINRLGGLCDKAPNDRLRMMARILSQRLRGHPPQMPNLIPIAQLGLFEPSIEKPIFTENVLLGIRTLFDLLRAKNMRFSFIAPPVVRSDLDVVRMIRKENSKGNSSIFSFIKFSALDSIGHAYGPDSAMVKKGAAKVDAMIKSVVQQFRKVRQDVSIVIISDHGMSEVKGAINFKKIRETVNAAAGINSVSFLDSTMARFWIPNREEAVDAIEEEISSTLKDVKHVHVLTKDEKTALEIPKDRRCGDIILSLDEGYVVHPCYFHISRVPKGMHGYAYASTAESFPAFLLNTPNRTSIKDNVSFAEVFRLLVHLLKLKTNDRGEI